MSAAGIEVTVQLHTTLRRQAPNGWVSQLRLTLSPGSRLLDLLEQLEVEYSDEALMLVVNGRNVTAEYELHAGDRIDLIPAISGG